jgi:glucokinase
MTETLYASIDLGGTKVACAFGTAEGRVVAERTIPTASHEGPLAVLDRIGGMVNAMAVEIGTVPAAAGMGVPGLADVAQGVTRFLPNLPTQWRDVRVRDVLAPQIGCPVYLLNDVRTATLGELTYGHGRGAQSSATMVFFALGTGIGGGVVIDGKLRLGPLGAAGELGHQTVQADGPLCGCGNRGCLETLASGPAISAQGMWLLESGRAPALHALVNGDAGRITPREMAQAADAGDEGVRDVLLRAAEFLGIGIANVVVTLHPDLVVLGGGVAQIGDLLFDAVRETVRRRVRMFPVDGIQILPSLLGNRAGMLGGLALASRGGVGQ